ncbi:MAG: alpha/beta fold hydrolase [Candidatus Helarchaeota archaeon]
MPYMELSHVKMFYIDEGDVDAPVITMIHGWTESHKFWEEQVNFFKEDYRVIALDLKGHGRSTKRRHGYLMRNLSNDVFELLHKLDVTRTIMFGHSLGGMVTLDFYFRRPLQVDAICLFNTTYKQFSLIPRNFTELRGAGLFGIRKFLLQFYDFKPEEIVNLSQRKKDNVEELIEEASRTPPYITVRLGLASTNFNVERKLPRIKVPTLLVYGERDAVTPVRIGRSMQRKIPNSTLYVVKNSGHMAPLEKSEEVNAAIADFLEKNGLKRH